MLDELSVLGRGMVLGFVVAAPVGPIGLLCIRRTVQKGLLIGFATGMGAAVADAFFGGIAAFGMAKILTLVQSHQKTIQLFGGAILLLMAWRIWRTHHFHGAVKDVRVSTVIRAFLSALALTFTNPVTIFAVLAVVAALGGDLPQIDASILTTGVFCGSALWWLMLSGGVAMVRHKFTERSIKTVNRITAVILIGIAGWALVSGISSILVQF